MTEPPREATDGLERARNAPWYGSCGLCQFTMWHGDSEAEVRGLLEEHVKTEHRPLINVWPNPNAPAPARDPASTTAAATQVATPANTSGRRREVAPVRAFGFGSGERM